MPRFFCDTAIPRNLLPGNPAAAADWLVAAIEPQGLTFTRENAQSPSPPMIPS